MTLPLAGKVSIVTGASQGIGKAVAILLARSGSRVVLAARSEPQLRSVSEEIFRQDGEALVIPTDLTVDQEMERLVEQTIQTWGSVDILINNAGSGKVAPVVKAKVSDWDETFRVNLRAPMVLSKLVLPKMMERGEGSIINMSSVSGKSGQANGSAYSASKFGLMGFTQSLFDEVREFGIRVAAICPGFVDTPLIPQMRRMDRSKMIRPEDVAQTVLFVLTSPPTACPVEIIVRPQRTPYA